MATVIHEGDASSSLTRHGGRRHFLVVLLMSGAVFGSMLWEMCQEPLKHGSQGKDIMGNLRSSVHASCHWCIGPQQDQHLPWSFRGEDDSPDTETHSPGRDYYYINRSNMVLEFNSTVQFIFTVGLEGTGHHLMGSIAKESPAVRRLKQFGIWDTMVGPLHHVLFSHYLPWKDRDIGIWNAHCTSHRKAAELEHAVVEKLKNIEAQVKRRARNYIDSAQNLTGRRVTLPLPLNTVKAENGGRVGQVSYPNYMGNCRDLNYPDLNLLYNACRKAKVDCLQVYVYRHPFDILQSISRRGFGKSNAVSMQLYIEHLHVIANQIRMHASRTLGCFGFFSDEPQDKYWVDAQRDLWAWDDADEYRKSMEAIYKDPRHDNITEEEKAHKWLASSRQKPYIVSLWKMHQHVIQTCRHAVKEIVYR